MKLEHWARSMAHIYLAEKDEGAIASALVRTEKLKHEKRRLENALSEIAMGLRDSLAYSSSDEGGTARLDAYRAAEKALAAMGDL